MESRLRMREIARARAVVALIACLLMAPPAHAGLPETPQPQQLTVADGLPSNRINDIAQDADGYLWLATSDGLARYDGIGFRVWRIGEGLRDNFVWAVHVDASNRVWIGTSSAGLAMLDVDRNTFHYFDRGSNPRIGSDEVWSIASTRDGALWFGTGDGGLHRMAANGAITRFMPRVADPRSLPDASVGQLAVARDGSLWVGTKNGVAAWTGHDFARLPSASLHSASINGLSVDADGTLWIGTARGVNARLRSGVVTDSPWRHYRKTLFHVLLHDRSGIHWLDTADGLGRDSGGEIRNVPLYSNAARGTVKPSWSRAFEDRDGGLWFASNDSGLWYLRSSWRRFSVLTRQLGDPASPANAYVHGIAPSRSGDMWLVGSGGVLDRLDPESGTITHVLRDAGAGYMPMGVHEDRGGRVWISYYRGLARWDPVTGAMRRWSALDTRDAALPSERAAFAETGDGVLWIASERIGMQRRDGNGRLLESIAAGGRSGLAPDFNVEQIAIGPDDHAWIAGSRGLLAWQSRLHRFAPVVGALPGAVFGFAFVQPDAVWLARFGALERYRWNAGKLTLSARYNAAQGLPQLAPNGLTIDRDGMVWMTSTRGLVRFDPVARSTRLYGVRDGLPSQEFGEAPVPRVQDGRIAAATPDGLVLFDPTVVQPSARRATLVVASIDVRRGERRIGLDRQHRIALMHGDRDLRVVARLLSFDNARSNRYRFRLQPYDKAWIDVDAGGARLFPQLPPGDYVLQLQARGPDTAWSRMRSQSLHVAPPWWRTAWALVLFVMAGVTSLALITQAYRRRLQRQHAWELGERERNIAQRASQAKTHFLATLGHEVRTPMTGVLGMSELLLGTPLDTRQQRYAESIRSAGNHLLRLVDDALDLARIEAGKLQPQPQPFALHALLADVVALMAPVAQRRGLCFEQGTEVDVVDGVLGDPLRIRQVLLNLLGNAIKFTEHGSVVLRVSMTMATTVRFAISDTGPGMDASQQARLFRRFEQADGNRTAARYGGSGLGLAICDELVNAMGGCIHVDSAPGRGTCFVVELPLPHAPLPPLLTHAITKRAMASGNGLHLLLVEDDPMVAEVIEDLLQAQGHRITRASHGLIALAEIANADFDMALLDLDLPGMDGCALARLLRTQGHTLPLLAITARADAEAEPQALAAGCNGFVRKPVTGTMLADAVSALLPDGLLADQRSVS